jgi:hypothetical protein
MELALFGFFLLVIGFVLIAAACNSPASAYLPAYQYYRPTYYTPSYSPPVVVATPPVSCNTTRYTTVTTTTPAYISPSTYTPTVTNSPSISTSYANTTRR